MHIVISEYLRTANNSRMLFANIGSVAWSDKRVFIKRLDGELEMVLAFDTAEEAELEMLSINEQLAAWEVAKATQTRARVNSRR